MPKPWEKYGAAAPAAGPWEKYAQSAAPAQPVQPPANPLEDKRGFFESAIDAINPLPAIREYIDRPSQWRGVSEVLGTRRGSPEEAAALDRNAQALKSNPMGLTLPLNSETLPEAINQARQGNIAGAAGTLTGGYAVPAVGGAALSQPGRAAIRTGVQKTTQAVQRAVMPVPTPVKAMTQALRPKSTNLEFSRTINTALPEIKASEASIGRPIRNIDDMLEATKDAKQRVWSQYQEIAGPQALRGVDGSPIADSIVRSIPTKLKLENPAAAGKIAEMAENYRRTFTIQELETLLQETNAELNSYYAKYPNAQRAALKANPETARVVAQAEATRKTIYEALDTGGEGAAPRELKRRYGALLNAESEIYRRKNVADRQAPENLPQQISKIQQAATVVRAGVKAAKLDVLGAGAELSEGLAMRRAADWLREQNSTNGLIERTFATFDAKPVPVSYTPPRIAGLLTEGSLKTPPPADPSSVRAVPGQYAVREPITAPNRLLMPPSPPARQPMVTPPPADTSYVRSAQPKTTVVRDPKTGRMKRVYLSDQK